MNKRLCGLFSVLALRDEKVLNEYLTGMSSGGDPVLGEMFKLMDRSRNDLVSRLFNSWFTATVLGFLSCLIALILMRTVLDRAPRPGQLTPFQNDLLTAVTFGLAAWFAGRWALSIRHYMIERKNWIPFDRLHRFRPSQHAGIFLSAYGVGFLLMMCSTFLFTLMNGDGDKLTAVSWPFFIYPLCWAFIPATAAVALCCLADWVSRDGTKPANIYVISFALSFCVGVTATLSLAITDSVNRVLAHSAAMDDRNTATNNSGGFFTLLSSDATVTALVFTTVGFILFAAILQGHKKDELAA
jgi:hypothetical protein